MISKNDLIQLVDILLKDCTILENFIDSVDYNDFRQFVLLIDDKEEDFSLLYKKLDDIVLVLNYIKDQLLKGKVKINA